MSVRVGVAVLYVVQIVVYQETVIVIIVLTDLIAKMFVKK
jgi:hypothetical protein